ncbi:MAG: hypothetical protein M3077_01820 [Candidatus Dormibacteraeota bacterium]|nr:hypothetical protein [Candidatus Dormibacteraeota bacterium]
MPTFISFLLRHPWRVLAWVAIVVLASAIVPGVEPFLPLLLAALGIAMFEGALRLLARR